MGISKTSDHIQIKITIQNSSQEPRASSNAPNEDLKDRDILYTFKIKIESQNLKYECIKHQWSFPNQNQHAKTQSGTSNTLQSPKWGLKKYGCFLYLQNHGWEPKFGSWVYQRPVTISKLRSICQTPVRNLQHHPEPQMRTISVWLLFAPSNPR